MSSTVDIPIRDILDTSSPFYSQPWPDVTLKAIDVLKHYAGHILGTKGQKIVRANAPPFKFVLNLSSREVRLDGDVYSAGELASFATAARWPTLSFVAGPHTQLGILVSRTEAASEAHAKEIARRIEDEIIEALVKEAARMDAQN